jgi:PEP-CTERM motif
MRESIAWGLFRHVARAWPILAVAFAADLRAAQIFDFSINSTLTGGAFVTGSVSGFVDLPFNGNGTGPASQVVIENVTGVTLATPVDALTWSNLLSNTFTVSGGQITASVFTANDSAAPMPELGWNIAASEAGLTVTPPSGLQAISSDVGPTFTFVPEPSTFALAALAFFALAVSTRLHTRSYWVR